MSLETELEGGEYGYEETEPVPEEVEPAEGEEIVGSTSIAKPSKRLKEMTLYEKAINNLRKAFNDNYKNIIPIEAMVIYMEEFSKMPQIIVMNMYAFATALVMLFLFVEKHKEVLPHTTGLEIIDEKYKKDFETIFEEVKSRLTQKENNVVRARATMIRYINAIKIFRENKIWERTGSVEEEEEGEEGE